MCWNGHQAPFSYPASLSSRTCHPALLSRFPALSPVPPFSPSVNLPYSSLTCSPALSPALPLPLSSRAPSRASHPPILRLPSCLTLTSSIFCDISLLCFSCALCFSHNRFFSHIPRFSRSRFFLTTDGKNQHNQNLSLCDSSFSPTVKLRTEPPESFYLENQTSTGKAGGQNYKFMK